MRLLHAPSENRFFRDKCNPPRRRSQNNPHHTCVRGGGVASNKIKERPPSFLFPNSAAIPLKDTRCKDTVCGGMTFQKLSALGARLRYGWRINTGCFVWQGAAQNGVRPCLMVLGAGQRGWNPSAIIISCRDPHYSTVQSEGVAPFKWEHTAVDRPSSVSLSNVIELYLLTLSSSLSTKRPSVPAPPPLGNTLAAPHVCRDGCPSPTVCPPVCTYEPT